MTTERMISYLKVRLAPDAVNPLLFAEDPGCGCCGGTINITEEQLDKFIGELTDELANARQVKTQWISLKEKHHDHASTSNPPAL